MEELQDERPDYVDPLGQSANEIYENVTDLYFQLYIDQGTVRMDDLAESGQDPESDWHAAQRAYKSIDRYMYGFLPQPGQEKSAANGEPYPVRNSEFNRPTEAHLEEHLPHVETPEDFIEYVKTELPKLIPEYANNKINWDSLTYEEAAMFYYAALEAGALEYRGNPRLYNLGNPEQVDQKLAAIGAEKTLIGELMRKMAIVTPLEDLNTLLELYGWVSEDQDQNKANAEAYFQRRLKAVYEHLGRELPSNWEEIQNDPVTMANMLVDIYPELEEKGTYKFIQEDYKWTGYDMFGEEYAKLTREKEPFNPLPLAADILSWLYPPFGVALTVAKMYHSGVVQGDWGAAAEQAAGLAIPRLPRVFAAGSRLMSSVPQLTGTANALAALSESSELAFALDMRGLYKDMTGFGEAIVPDTPETLMANMDNVLAEIQTQGVDLNEIPEGMPPQEWYALVRLLEGSEHMTQADLVHVIQMGFRTTLRENRQYPHGGGQ
ncbi:MAG: hypothetical protein OXG60_06680 [Chloroflexi bacterium]|nr:hypothetical protein [Chloroflexota bacterium]